MFGQAGFVGLNGAGGEVRLAQAPAYPPAPAATPAPAPAPVPAPVVVAPAAPAPVVVDTGMSHGVQIAIGVTILGLAVIGLMSLTD